MRLTDNDWAGILKRTHELENVVLTLKSVQETLIKEIKELKEKVSTNGIMVQPYFPSANRETLEKPVAPEMPPLSKPRIVSESGKERKVKE